MTRLSIFLRIIVGLGIVAAVFVAGFQHRSPWIVLPLAVAFSVMYVTGKPLLLRRLGPWKLVMAIFAAIPAQIFVVGLLFLAGYGAGSLADGSRGMGEFTNGDVYYCLWLLGLGGGLGTVAAVIELRAGDPMLDLDPDEFLAELLGEGPEGRAPKAPSTPSARGASGD